MSKGVSSKELPNGNSVDSLFGAVSGLGSGAGAGIVVLQTPPHFGQVISTVLP
ncbi:MAG: hypothetical protein NUV60_02335 [Patescibacteria group bacterium]|nr:hypothetical protein [Patescibacteria group bacterium]